MNIVSTIVDTIKEMITGSAQALSEGMQQLLFQTDAQGQITNNLSSAGTVIFTLFAVGMGVGLMYVLLRIFTRR